jgi:fumarate hydratase subunit beta
MTKTVKLTAPLSRSSVAALESGDQVLLDGIIYAARDAAHKRIIETLDAKGKLPVSLADQIIYYTGPSPGRPGQTIGSAGPTTSGRMDKYTLRLLELGLRGMIGKGERSPAIREAIHAHGAVYFIAPGGAAALLARHITNYRVIAYPELGPEALAELTVRDFSLIVGIDAQGNDFYKQTRDLWKSNILTG